MWPAAVISQKSSTSEPDKLSYGSANDVNPRPAHRQRWSYGMPIITNSELRILTPYRVPCGNDGVRRWLATTPKLLLNKLTRHAIPWRTLVHPRQVL